MTAIDPVRHLSYFSPHAFGARRVDVIGAGATGKPVIEHLAYNGVENIHIHDFDTVNEENLAPQHFAERDIGLLKVEAIARSLKERVGATIHTHADRVDGSQQLGEIVFLLTDTMSSRKEIFEKGLKLKMRTRLVIETRTTIDAGRIYAFNPNLLSHIRGWEDTLYTDDEVQDRTACGTSPSISTTAGVIAGLAGNQMIRWFNIEQGQDDILENEVIIGLRSMAMITRQF